ncbi:MAG: signal peptidase II [Gemmatimonadota bacterium]|nr:signal peptidase II [Gemmatimonadota bacterium]
MRYPGRVFWPLAAALVLTDCATKRVIEATALPDGLPRPVINDIVRFALAYNQGAAFSTHFGPYQRWVLVALTLAILAALTGMYSRVARMGWPGVTGMAMVAGGAVGNLLDRLASNRGVVDFIDVGVGDARFYVFNVADVGVSVGAVLLAYALWRDYPARGVASTLPRADA